jgi:Rhomboid family
MKWGTNFGPETLSGGWWRLFTSVFTHFGLMHLLLNMVTLYQIGRLAERLYGSGRFLVLSCALALVVFGASAYVLARASEGIREELQFKKLVLTLDPAEQKAMHDMLALMPLPVGTQSERDVVANRVMQEVVPQWENCMPPSTMPTWQPIRPISD